MEKEIEVITYAVAYVCDNCNEREMTPNGIMKMLNPPLYEHVCMKCGFKKNLRENYPLIKYRRNEELK